MKLVLVVTTVLLMTLPRTGSAQADPDSVIIRNRCRLAEQIVWRGRPAPHEGWALRFISQCGETGGQAIAAGLRALRSETDTALLGSLITNSLYLRDGRVFEAAVEVALDRTASEEARITSLRAFVWLAEPHTYIRFGDMLPEGRLGLVTCSFSWVGHVPFQVGAPLPPDYLARLLAAARAIEADSSESPRMRAAAHCARREAERPGG